MSHHQGEPKVCIVLYLSISISSFNSE